jgi:hypothetical protein
MTPLLDRPRQNRPFARADILSQLGETIFLPEVTPSSRPPKPTRVNRPTTTVPDEDPERWDGLA